MQSLTYFPTFFTRRAIICYAITLALVSALFISNVLPFQFMLFGIVAVILFFTYSSSLTMNWQRIHLRLFTRRLFITALLIRVVYVVFIYFYYIEMTGMPFMYHHGDEGFYQGIAQIWYESGFEEFLQQIYSYVEFSDRGYIYWLGFLYRLFGSNNVLVGHVEKCFVDAFSCILIYNLAKSNFGEAVGRMAAIFYMLMPNAWYYCGVTLKETEMSFLVILFVERADLMLHFKKIRVNSIIIPLLCVLTMFTFRTAMATVMIAALAVALFLSTSKQMQSWKKILFGVLVGVWMFATVGFEMLEETQQLWQGRNVNQVEGYEWRSTMEGGNSFAKYATATVFAPFIFTIPFSTIVEVVNQENQMMLNGANFIKNIMSGFVVFAMFSLLLSGEWRKHVLPIALTLGYLVVLVFSNFAHSERFHFPVMALELLFAAYGVSLMRNKHKRWYVLWLVFVCLANVVWSYIKLAGRGIV